MNAYQDLTIPGLALLALLALLVLVLLLALGAWLYRLWMSRRKRRIPRHWPIHARELLSEEELRVWRWLNTTFEGYHIMIKTPVTRFTKPNPTESGLFWYELLKGIYCTFTVCNEIGQVLGCVDVPRTFGASRKVRLLKENLLAQCGIGYTVVSPTLLPEPDAILQEFLGDEAARIRSAKREEAVVRMAKANLQQTLVVQRGRRKIKEPSMFGPETSSMPSHWNDSFLIQDNTRPAELR